jgi:hypothetical protein
VRDIRGVVDQIRDKIVVDLRESSAFAPGTGPGTVVLLLPSEAPASLEAILERCRGRPLVALTPAHRLSARLRAAFTYVLRVEQLA